MENDSLNAAAERIKAGAQIPTIEPSQIEHVWEVLSRRTNMATGLATACANLDFAPKSPDEQLALMTRYALLDALVERGIKRL